MIFFDGKGRRLFIFLLLVGAGGISLLVFGMSNTRWNKQLQRIIPLHDSIKHARTNASKGQVVLERLLSSDPSIRPKDVWPYFNQAQLSVKDCINGRSNILNLPAIPPENDIILKKLHLLQTELDKLSQLARNRWEMRNTGQKISIVQQRSTFYKVEQLAEAIEFHVEGQLIQMIDVQEKFHRLMFFLLLFTFTTAGSTLLFISYKRHQAEKKLKLAFDDLELNIKKRTVDLHETNEQLKKEITMRKLSETELRASRNRHQSLYENTPVMLHSIDQQGRIISVSNYWLEKLGYEREEVIGKYVVNFLTKESKQYAINVAIPSFFQKGFITDVQYQLKKKDGEVIDTLLSAIVDEDAKGNFIQTLAVIIDVTEKYQTEKNLASALQHISAHIENSPLAIIEFDPQFKIVRWSREAEKIFGWRDEEIIGISISEIRWIYEEDEEFVAREYAGLLDGTRPRSLNINRNYRKDGSVVHCEWYNSAIYDSKGNLVSILSQVLDITKRKQDEQEKAKLESLLRQAHKMQAVGTMAGGIAHNFNNLLGVIMGCTDMARDEVPADSFARKQLDRALKASFTAKNLVQQILIFSRQKMDRKRNSLNLASCIRETLDLIKSSTASSVDLNINLAGGCNLIFADSSEISQILMNLCSNAVWAMKEKGALTISLELVDLSNKKAAKTLGLTTGQYLKLSVKDTGVGMTAETKERIFEPFFTTKEVGQGTGMGLATVIGSMESYKGAITVDSSPGKGTTFHLYFPTIYSDPVEKKDVYEGDAGESDQIPTGTERILFVDDKPMYTEMGKDILKSLGYSVSAEIDSEKALELFRAAPDSFDLVITDQIMPHISGDDLTREILAIKPDIPIILCTGYSTQIDAEKAKSIGIKEYVLKPIVKKDIAKLIRKVLDD